MIAEDQILAERTNKLYNMIQNVLIVANNLAILAGAKLVKLLNKALFFYQLGRTKKKGSLPSTSNILEPPFLLFNISTFTYVAPLQTCK